MSDTSTSYTCPWCHIPSDGAGAACAHCGAPVDIRRRTTDSGWAEQPAIPDMARIQFGQSSCQVEGMYVPVADMKLAAGDHVYFSHHVLLWQDESVELSTLPMRDGWSRTMAGMPLVMLDATGPGHIAFSRDAPGELLAVPLQAGASVDVRENHFLVATGAVSYDWLETGVWFTTSGGGRAGRRRTGGINLLKAGLDLAFDSDSGGLGDVLGGMSGDSDGGGDDIEWHYPLGRYLDRFTASSGPGLLLIHAAGNSFVRTLGPDETILVKPPALLWKEPSVGLQLHVEYPTAGVMFWRSWGNRYLWLRLFGPGRVALQSAYEAMEDPGTDFQGTSGHTEQHW
jgi:uncharacterized protein (AIM24 family)